MVHTIAISAHALAGTLALIAGVVALTKNALFGVYLWSMIGMEVSLLLAVAVGWPTLGAGTRVLFLALSALGAFMVWRAWRARLLLPVSSAGPSREFVDHIGFTLVALIDAFLVITVLNAGAPVWLVVATAVGVGVAGHFVLRAGHRRLVPQPKPA